MTIETNLMEKFSMARPTDYCQEILDALIEYSDRPPTYMTTKTVIGRNGPVEVEEEVNNKLPSVEGFCREQKISKDTFYNWVKKYPEFSDAFSDMKQAQQDNLFTNALENRYNAGFAKFMAVNLTSFRDKSSTDVTTNGKEMENKVIILPSNGRD